MKKRHLVMAGLLMLIWHVPDVDAAEFEGAGIQLCSDYIESYKIDPTITSTVYFNWAEGFMSGLNIARLNDTTAFKAMPIDQQKAQLLNFCEAHPTERYWKAVADLYTTIYPKPKRCFFGLLPCD